jgi:hypothetical protein
VIEYFGLFPATPHVCAARLNLNVEWLLLRTSTGWCGLQPFRASKNRSYQESGINSGPDCYATFAKVRATMVGIVTDPRRDASPAVYSGFFRIAPSNSRSQNGVKSGR